MGMENRDKNKHTTNRQTAWVYAIHLSFSVKSSRSMHILPQYGHTFSALPLYQFSYNFYLKRLLIPTIPLPSIYAGLRIHKTRETDMNTMMTLILYLSKHT